MAPDNDDPKIRYSEERSRILGRIIEGDLDDQIERIKRDKATLGWTHKRRTVLHGLGIRHIKPKAENLVIFGCPMPVQQPLELVSFTRMLDHLGVDWTYIKEGEYCCGFTLLERAPEKDRERVVEFCRELAQKRFDAGVEHGAKNIIYYCQWCSYMAKWGRAQEGVDTHGLNLYYHLDFFNEILKDVPLEVKQPTRVGYYQGCQRRNRETLGKDYTLDWRVYRELVGRIKNLEVVNIKSLSGKCCLEDPVPIVQDALNKNVDYIMTSCVACLAAIERGTRWILKERRPVGIMPVKMSSEVLYETIIGPENYWRKDFGF